MSKYVTATVGVEVGGEGARGEIRDERVKVKYQECGNSEVGGWMRGFGVNLEHGRSNGQNKRHYWNWEQEKNLVDAPPDRHHV